MYDKEHLCMNLILNIRKINRLLDKYTKYLNQKYNITLPQLICLYEIKKEKSINLTELTRRVNLNNSAITGIIDRLELKGYVQRVKSGKDRRIINIELTEKGTDFVDRSFQVLEEDCFFEKNKFDEEAIIDLIKSIQKITDSIDPEVKKIKIN
ncbi:MAG: MarR family transcriptional regulator [Flexistipes sinusarabici]|uniref:MarR family transcriptional regulator n=1 Tax=Flexistipes sinusarabici TaxID=2352 RepID=A0A5D0MJP5_FLESI|nr:MarR family transcriptional regulator [Flexistipes sinusarabici]TYB32612.1 MAG: MarR family transcriptional regulator [Flexistipes sinusarabici]